MKQNRKHGFDSGSSGSSSRAAECGFRSYCGLQQKLRSRGTKQIFALNTTEVLNSLVLTLK